MYLAESKVDAVGWHAPDQAPEPAYSIPPLIDNLWEWKRPESAPSRRISTFASPSVELALRHRRLGRGNARIYRIALPVGARVAQLTSPAVGGFDPSDSCFHPDVADLPRVLMRSLGPDWAARRLRGKVRPGLLWVPYLFKEEIEGLFRHVPELWRIRDRMWNAIGYWHDVRVVRTLDRLPDPRGEIFFESREGYWRDPLKEAAARRGRKPGLLARLLHDGVPSVVRIGD